MKKRVILLIFLSSLILLFEGCNWLFSDEEQIEPDPLPNYNLEVAISASPDTILLGEKSNISWSATDGADIYTTINGQRVYGPSGVLPVSPQKTTTYIISSTLKGVNKSSEVTIVVEPPVYVATRADTIDSRPWRLDSTRSYDPVIKYLFNYELSEVQLTDVYKFDIKNGRARVYHKGETVPFGDADCVLNSSQDSLYWGGLVWGIDLLTDESMYLSTHSPYYIDKTYQYDVIGYSVFKR